MGTVDIIVVVTMFLVLGAVYAFDQWVRHRDD